MTIKRMSQPARWVIWLFTQPAKPKPQPVYIINNKKLVEPKVTYLLERPSW